jgi:hypothetical protein
MMIEGAAVYGFSPTWYNREYKAKEKAEVAKRRT